MAENAQGFLQGPRWHNNSCALDTLLWVAKVLQRPMYDPVQTALWRTTADKNQRAFMRAVDEDWPAIVAEDHAKRDELAKQLIPAILGSKSKVGEFIGIHGLWELVAEGLPTTTLRLQSARKCHNGVCAHLAYTPLGSGRTGVVLAGATLSKVTTPPITLSSCFDAYFGNLLWEGRGGKCERCGKGPVYCQRRAMDDQLPPIILVDCIMAGGLESGELTAHFRFYGPAPRSDKYNVVYRTRAMVIKDGGHFTGLALQWEGDRLVGGWSYDGMRKDKRVVVVGEKDLNARLREVRRRAREWEEADSRREYDVLLWMVRSDVEM